MKILAIDTSGPVCSAAISQDGRLTHEYVINNGLTHSETLMPMVESLMDSARLTPGDIDLFAVVAGPGSFTGVRIGVCATRALAHATGKPIARINALDALSYGAYCFEGVVCPILDARRGQVYCAAYRFIDDALTRLLPCAALPIGEFFDALPEDGRLYFLGDGAPVFADDIRSRFPARALIAPSHLTCLKAGAACRAAEETPESAYLSPNALTPIYLRAPQAERERSEKSTRAKTCALK